MLALSIPTPGHTHDSKEGESLVCGGDQAHLADWTVKYFFNRSIIIMHNNDILIFDKPLHSLVKFGQAMKKSTGKKPNHSNTHERN